MLAFAGAYGPRLASWLLAHPDELGAAAARVIRPAMTAITDPSASLDRIGSALVAQQNGHREVVGLLHQHTTKLDGITAAVDGIGVSVDEIGRSIGLLSSLTMVGLGVAVLSQVHLAFQFAALTDRLKRLEKLGQQIQGMIKAEHRAKLTAGLVMLKNGLEVSSTSPAQAGRFFDEAVSDLTRSSANYAEQLAAEAGSSDHAYPWLLARHLAVSALGEAAAHLRSGQPGLAVRSLNTALVPLRGHTRAVFTRTVTPNPTRFLMPALAEHGLTLDVLAELYRQAGHAGVLDAKAHATAPELFESLRGRLREASDPTFGRSRKMQRLRAEFAEASAAVEEVNRLQGLALTIEQCGRVGQDYFRLSDEIVRTIEDRRPEEGACFAAFPPFAA